MLANKSEEKGERRRRTPPQVSRSLLHNQEKTNAPPCMEKLVRRSPVSAITTKHPKSFETSVCTTGQKKEAVEHQRSES
jgi:hypothetical protein